MKIIISAVLLFIYGIALHAQLQVYPNTLKTGMKHNDDFTVCVRQPGGVWQDLFEYNVQVDMDNVQNASMVQFDMDSPVEVMVRKNNGTIYDVAIRPLSKAIKHTIQHNAVLFTLDRPHYLSIEFNGDRLHNLHLFANPMETEIYTGAQAGIMYFGPGVHQPKDLPNNQIQVPSNTTVYLAPGAILKAKLLVDNAENVRIIGRGILNHPLRGVEVTHSKNVLIDGITVVNPDHYTIFGGEADGLIIRNLKSFSCKGWSDGIDLMSCRNVEIDNVFLRNSDDCIALYAHRWRYYGDVRNITVKNSVLWADIAHPINIGGHGDYNRDPGDTLEDITFQNIDILEHDEDDPPYQGAITIDAGDRNLVRRVLFEDIRIENIQEGRLFTVNVRFNDKYDHAPGRGIEDVVFRNITYNGVGENRSVVMGYSKKNRVKNVLFDNVMINGEKMKDINGFISNEFVEGIKIK